MLSGNARRGAGALVVMLLVAAASGTALASPLVTLTWREAVPTGFVEHSLQVDDAGTATYERDGGAPLPLRVGDAWEVALQAEMAITEAAVADGAARPGPCGAPLAGILTLRGGAPIDLAAPEAWERYGELARLVQGLVTPRLPGRASVRCAPLMLSAVLPPPPTPTSPRPLSAAVLRDAMDGPLAIPGLRLLLLARLAELPGSDPFYREDLLRRAHDPQLVTEMLSRDGAALVEEVGTPEQARGVLHRLPARGGPGMPYERALLDVAAERFEDAARELDAFYAAQGRSDVGTHRADQILALRDAVRLADAIRDPHGGRRRALHDAAVAYAALGREVWSGNPMQAPPLAILFFYRATRYARRIAHRAPDGARDRRDDDAVLGEEAARILVRYHGAVAAHERQLFGDIRARVELAAQYDELAGHPGAYGDLPGWSTLESPPTAAVREVLLERVRGTDHLLHHLVPAAARAATLVAVGRAYLEIGKAAAARAAFAEAGVRDGSIESARSVSSNDPALLEARAAVAFTHAGRPHAAALARAHARALAGDDPAALVAVGDTVLGAGTRAAAIAARRAFARALDLETADPLAWLGLAEADLAAGRAADALRDAQAARRADPANAAQADAIARAALLRLPPPLAPLAAAGPVANR